MAFCRHRGGRLPPLPRRSDGHPDGRHRRVRPRRRKDRRRRPRVRRPSWLTPVPGENAGTRRVAMAVSGMRGWAAVTGVAERKPTRWTDGETTIDMAARIGVDAIAD